jgi:phosphoglycolate phosphatase
MSLKVIPKLLVFDLDGTLIDSRQDLTNSVNAMLAHYGKMTLNEGIVASYIGDGAGVLVRRALAHAHVIADEDDPHDDEFVEEALDWFIAYYKIHKVDFTVVYPGVVDSLETIRRLNPALPMAVLTNKPVNPSRAICRHFGLERFFFANYGGNSFESKKPDPEGLLTLIAEASALVGKPIDAGATVMIGDSHVDVFTARACGAVSLGCTFGLAPESLRAARPDLSVDDASEWPRVLGMME